MKFKMSGIISFRFKRCLPFPQIIRELKEILWNPIFWQHILFISENAYGIEHLPFHMAILHKCDSRLSPKQKALQGKNGQSFTIYTIKKVSYGQIGRIIEGIIEKWIKDFSKEMPIV